jgi:DNA recombination protein RmuC
MLITVVVCLVVLFLLSFCGLLWYQRDRALKALSALEVETATLRASQGSKETMSETFKGLAASALNEALGQYQTHLAVLEKDRAKTLSSLDHEIKRMGEASITLAKETGALKDALKRPHVRGRWGEVQLRNCIELAGMSEYADVSFQDTSSDSGARPDMVVRMPGGRRVIVDAKTPIDAFLNSLDAATEEVRRTEMVRHGRHVKEHVKKLATRAYNDVLEGSADFTVLFLPNESFLYAALEAEPDIMEFAMQKKILIATPPTLIGLLKVIRHGWSEQRLAENAQRISEHGQELHKRLCDFVDSYIAMGKHLDKAKEEFDKNRVRLESRVLVQARRFEALGAKSPKTLDFVAEPPQDVLQIPPAEQV